MLNNFECLSFFTLMLLDSLGGNKEMSTVYNAFWGWEGGLDMQGFTINK